MSKIITVTIDAEANSTVDLEGYHGVGCDAVLNAFSQAIGKATKTVLKPEHNRPQRYQNTVINKQ